MRRKEKIIFSKIILARGALELHTLLLKKMILMLGFEGNKNICGRDKINNIGVLVKTMEKMKARELTCC